MIRIAVALLAACLMASPALADKDKDKGKEPGQGQGQSQDAGQGKKGEPPGQQVSGCNHQANEMKLKGEERQRFVERCVERGGDRWSTADNSRNCRERADRYGLKGDAREDFIRRCREYRDDGPQPRSGGKDDDSFNPRGKDAVKKKDS